MDLNALVDKAIHKTATLAWPVVQELQRRIQRELPKAAWAPEKPRKSKNVQKPPLGWPRRTDSLCPRCVKEVRDDLLSGRTNLKDLINGKPGEVKALIREKDGGIIMEKDCPKHGHFEDVMSIDTVFMERIEGLFPGYDFKGVKTKLREHGTSSIQFGRGSVLTVDLTNRCNMMCDPCFMDANQVGYVHELTWPDIKEILDNSINISPRRQMSVQFSGGEPTLSPFFFDAIKYSKDVGYFCVQCATNGIAFAEDPEFAKKAKAAGLRLAYLQFDGIGNEKNIHRKIGNLFDVKLRAIENLHAAGIDVVLVVTIVNGVNNDQVGPIIDFAIENADKITVVSFQPVSFTGRDEDISDEDRVKQRYTLSHLAHDMKAQTGITEPHRDWFPLSAMGPFSDMVDALNDPAAQFGALKCGCHPNCGIGTILMVNKKTKEFVPLSQFLNIDQLLKDLTAITDAAHPKPAMLAQVALSLARNFDPKKAPKGYGFKELVKQFMSQTGASGVGNTTGDADKFEWRVLFIAGMWFQDLFNYDFRRTEMCIIPYGTQLGEISFCAYNTGVGFRQIVENMHKTATVAQWFKENGRHPVYAKGQDLDHIPDLHDHNVKVPKKRRSLNVVA
ncbi:MAG: radical SAM protein [Deltaproteobacteria bacterium]|nr:radical SAM protein [Deltaproteobacteria bacterium]